MPTDLPGESSLRSDSERAYSAAMEARVAVLEQIAKDTKDVLGEIKAELRELRRDQKSDFRLLFGAIITVALGLAGMIAGLGGIMAHGFHWY